ncbi:MAG: 50S ribosomal protein L28 [Planctomycetes bacterium]|nr:50S ribosomal protein L28 [Planctomycetota bacterium]
MPRECVFTGRRARGGWTKAEKGARRDGGVGNKIKGRTKRLVKPNLKKLRVVIDGEVQNVWVSTKAMRQGLVVKPMRVKAEAKAKAN